MCYGALDWSSPIVARPPNLNLLKRRNGIEKVVIWGETVRITMFVAGSCCFDILVAPDSMYIYSVAFTILIVSDGDCSCLSMRSGLFRNRGENSWSLYTPTNVAIPSLFAKTFKSIKDASSPFLSSFLPLWLHMLSRLLISLVGIHV